jgi:hypothetical protein
LYRRLVKAETRTFKQQKARRFSQTVPPCQSNDDEILDDERPARVVVDVPDVQTESHPQPALEQYEKLKQRQQMQMQALLLQQTEVNGQRRDATLSSSSPSYHALLLPLRSSRSDHALLYDDIVLLFESSPFHEES